MNLRGVEDLQDVKLGRVVSFENDFTLLKHSCSQNKHQQLRGLMVMISHSQVLLTEKVPGSIPGATIFVFFILHRCYLFPGGSSF